jgi:hypothetical protein
VGKVEIDTAKFGGRIFASARKQQEQAAEDLKRACQEECPVQSGNLLRNHKVIRITDERMIVLADTSYAQHVFDGDGPNGPRRPNRWMTRGIDRVRL